MRRSTRFSTRAWWPVNRSGKLQAQWLQTRAVRGMRPSLAAGSSIERSMLVGFESARRGRGRHALVLVGSPVERQGSPPLEDLRARRYDHVRKQRPVGAVPRHQDAVLHSAPSRSRGLPRDVDRLRSRLDDRRVATDDRRTGPARSRARRASLRISLAGDSSRREATYPRCQWQWKQSYFKREAYGREQRDCLVTDYEPFNQRSYSNPSAV